ncbi:MAG: VanZ family protein, partial [Acidobacteriota bacterium]
MYRRSYALLAFTTILFTFYVSLLPFRLRFEPWPDVWAEFASAMSASSERISRTNFLANVLLFVPVGLGLMGAQLAERPRRLARSVRAAAMTLLLSVAASLTAEFLQVFAPRRVVSPADVVAQTSGCGVGIVAWVMAGDSLTTWMRGLASRHRDDRVARLLTAYAAAWIIVNLAPFDIIVDLDL